MSCGIASVLLCSRNNANLHYSAEAFLQEFALMKSQQSSSFQERGLVSVGVPARSNEVQLSFVMLVLLSGVYIAYEILTDARGSHPFGHALGIIGTVLMVMTELLYSMRKRTRLLNWAGPVRHWLSFHIFTGIVGPFLVLMHTGLEFRGLAGVSMLLTVLVVASGFVGRYIYTAVPRTLSGVVATREQIMAEALTVQATLTRFPSEEHVDLGRLVGGLGARRRQGGPLFTVLSRAYYDWLFRLELNRALRSIERLSASQRRQLRGLLIRKRELDGQAEILESAHRLLSYWHIVHIPFGLTLFFSVAIHVVATFYFRAGLFK